MPKVIDREAKKKVIAKCAAIAIAEHGLGTVTLSHIARRNHCTTGTLGYYFDGKDDIIKAALMVTFDRLEDRLSKNTNADESFLEIIKEILPIDETRRLECRMWVNFWAHASYSEPLRSLNEELSKSWRKLILRCLRCSLPNLGCMPKNELNFLAATTVSVLFGLIVQSVTQPSKFKLDFIVSLLSAYVESVKATAVIPEPPIVKLVTTQAR